MTTSARRAILRRNARRRDLALYASLLETPQAGGTVSLPAFGSFALVAKANAAASNAAMTARRGGDASATNIGAPAMSAQERFLVGVFEAGTALKPAAAYDLYIDVGLGNWQPICIGA